MSENPSFVSIFFIPEAGYYEFLGTLSPDVKAVVESYFQRTVVDGEDGFYIMEDNSDWFTDGGDESLNWQMADYGGTLITVWLSGYFGGDPIFHL